MRRARGKGWLLAVAAVTAIIVLVLIVWMKVFVVRSVLVQGAEDLNQEEIVRASQIEFGTLIHKLDEDQLRQSLESGGKYALDGVLVDYPSTVILQVRERTKDAVVLNGGHYLTLDMDGCVVEVSTVVPDNNGIYVFGLENTAFRIGSIVTAPKEKLSAMSAVLTAVRTQQAIGYLSDLDLTDVDTMWATTRTGIRVNLGDEENMDEKILWMRSAVSDLEARGEIRGTLDVSSGNKADFRP